MPRGREGGSEGGAGDELNIQQAQVGSHIGPGALSWGTSLVRVQETTSGRPPTSVDNILCQDI